MAEELKKVVGEKAADMVEDGMVVGLGTGSTAKYAILRLGKRIEEEGLEIVGISTSNQSTEIAEEVGIPMSNLEERQEIDLTIDGADEVDPDLNLIKGLGGALLREKIVASCTRHEVIIVDGSKMVDTLGTKSPLPVEVLRFGWKKVHKTLTHLGCDPVLREMQGQPFITDGGNFILDCKFERIDEPEILEMKLNNIPGVIENGLFLGVAETVVVGTGEGVQIKRRGGH